MKTFKQLIAEVAQPNNEDELNFKEKHAIEVIDYPVSNETQHSSENKSPRRRADYEEGEDEDVYEEKKMDAIGKEDGDIDNDGDKDDSDAFLHARRKAIAKAMKEALVHEKKLDPVGQADADIDNDGDTDKSDEYLHARRKAIAKAMKEEVSKDHMDKALAAINSRITKKGDAPKYPSFDKAPEDIKTAVKNLAKQYAKQQNEEAQLIEKAVSQAQQQAAGVALAVKRGDKPKSALVGASKEMYKMSEKDLEDFAKTKHKGLPQKVEEAVNPSKVIASINAGDSIDVTVQKNLNKRGDNKDEILKVIRDYNWKKRMKKESTEQIDEVSKDKLKDYMNAARKDMRNRYYDDSAESDKKFANRSKGIEKALDKRDANSKAKVPATESVKLSEALPDHIVRGDGYEGIPDGIVMKAKETVKRMKPATASDHSRAMYKALADLGWEKAANGKWIKESFELTEAFTGGAVKLKDGSSINIKEFDAKLLNQLFGELSEKNRDAMMKTAMKDKKGFNEILSFAKEAL